MGPSTRLNEIDTSSTTFVKQVEDIRKEVGVDFRNFFYLQFLVPISFIWRKVQVLVYI